jgi:hypothetical protein
MSIYKPYCYLIGWSTQNKWYYGARWAKNCSPCDLWKTYFTSSKIVKKYREKYGEPDIIQIRKTFSIREEARLWEEKVQRRLNVIKDEKWLNRHHSNAKFCSDGSEETTNKIRKALLGVPRTEKAKMAMRKPKPKARGKKQTQEHIEKRIKSRRKEWIVTTPDNKTIRVLGLYTFCKENNLTHGASNMIHGGSYKGYRAIKI